jgi:hypothetical protein
VRFSAALPILAIGGVMTSGTGSSSAVSILLPMCLGGAHPVPLPVRRNDMPTNCPGACHAVCCRSRNALDFDESDQNA